MRSVALYLAGGGGEPVAYAPVPPLSLARLRATPRPCCVCARTFAPMREDAVYCGQTCRQRAAESRRGRR